MDGNGNDKDEGISSVSASKQNKNNLSAIGFGSGARTPLQIDGAQTISQRESDAGRSSQPNTFLREMNLQERESNIQSKLDEEPPVDMMGERFYCVLTNDVLQLFQSEAEAENHYMEE